MSYRSMIFKFNSIIKRLAVAMIHVFRLQLGFWGTPVCLFSETCTPFAQRQIEEKPLPVAIIIITWRIVRCNPITGLIFWIKSNNKAKQSTTHKLQKPKNSFL